ncbi:sensor domain-containing diguanylate cyclase [Lysinibacillus piscis]|uniref:Diguanylate cyclase n=1 Tax=Lysinibacillus piscis TaxID=2518931 RepID=A0ABQ5NLH6_9BACI|nr:diguanylate cyclase [Lysinibacillus sp. KH24]GLC89153.1 diguanylate cyclase [Lysinibacillus sp. KH24]
MSRRLWMMLLVTVLLCGGCSIEKKTIQDIVPTTQQTVYQLDGEWAMYPNQLLEPKQMEQQQATMVAAPLAFQDLWGDANGYATFHKQLQVDADFVDKTMSIYSQYMYTAYRLYIDGELVIQAGQVGATKAQSVPEMAAQIGYFTPKKDIVDIVLQISNFHHQQGGVNNDFVIGSVQNVADYYYYQQYQLFFQIGTILVMGVFAVLFALLAKRQKSFFVFGLFCFLMVVRGFFTGNILATTWLPNASWLTITRIEYLVTDWLSVVYVWTIYQLYKGRVLKWLLYSIVIIVCVLTVVTVLTEVSTFQLWFKWLFLFVVPICIYVLILPILRLRKRDFTAIWLLIGSLLMLVTVVNDYLVAQTIINTPQLAMYGATIFVLCQVIAVSHSYAKELQKTKYLNDELHALNRTLDDKVQASVQDVVEMNERLQQQVWKDGLTQVYNRHYFNEQCEQIWHQPSNIGLILMDVDEFKAFNDYYGHVEGDKVLHTFAQVASSVIPSTGFLARYGGEEFAVLLMSTTAAQCLEVAETIRQTIEQLHIEHKVSKQNQVTASIGVVFAANLHVYPKITDFINAADQALYKAKAEGRNQVIMTSN